MSIALREGEELAERATRQSNDGRFKLVMTQSGYLVLYRHELGELTRLWRHSCAAGLDRADAWARIHNGSFQGGYTFNNRQNLRWSYPPIRPPRPNWPLPPQPAPIPRRRLHLQDDGNLVLYALADNDAIEPVWSSRTDGSHSVGIHGDYPTAVLATGTLAIGANTFVENSTNAPINVYDGELAVLVPPGESVAVSAPNPGVLAIDICNCNYEYETGESEAVPVPDMTTRTAGNVVQIVRGPRRRPNVRGLNEPINLAGSRLPDALQWFAEDDPPAP